MTFPLPAPRPCRRCWRPITHCACEASTLLASDPVALARLEALKVRATRGAWRGEPDRWNGAQRLAFARWLVERERIGDGDLAPAYPLLTVAAFQADIAADTEAAAPSGEGQGGGANPG